MSHAESTSIRALMRGLFDAVEEALPEFSSSVSATVDKVYRYQHHAYACRQEKPESFPTIFSQLSNDFLQLLVALANGDGRPAMRAARSIFELAVADLDVHQDAEADKRYLDHRWVNAFQESGIGIGEELLSPDEQETELKRREWYRDNSLENYSHVTGPAAYGTGFARSWARLNLHDRAALRGLSDLYDLYRISSGVLHGAAGGGYGIEHLLQGRYIVRTGPALALCPWAYLFGLRSFERAIHAHTSVPPHAAVDDLLEQLRILENLWPKYRRAVLDLDRRLWPVEPPGPGFRSAVVVEPSGPPAWYVWDSHMERVTEAASPPLLSSHQQQGVSNLAQAVREAAEVDDEMGLAFIVKGVEVAPSIGARWDHSSLIFPEGPRLKIDMSKEPVRQEGE